MTADQKTALLAWDEKDPDRHGILVLGAKTKEGVERFAQLLVKLSLASSDIVTEEITAGLHAVFTKGGFFQTGEILSAANINPLLRALPIRVDAICAVVRESKAV